jgi:hypothetical protein
MLASGFGVRLHLTSLRITGAGPQAVRALPTATSILISGISSLLDAGGPISIPVSLYDERGLRAIALGTPSLTVREALEDQWGVTAALITLDVGEVNTGVVARRYEHLDNAVAAARSPSDPWLLAWALYWSGACWAGCGTLR